MSALDELLKKHRKKIIDREKKTFRELLKAYQEIEKDLSKSFKKLENEMKAALESGEEIDPSWLYNKKRLKKLLEQTNEQIIRFGGKAAKIIESEQQKAIEIAAEQSKEVYKFLLNQTPDASAFIPSLNTRNVETAVGLMGDKSPLISYFAETLAPDVAEKIRSEVIKATALGTNFQTVAKNLRAAGDISKSRAFSLARTEINRVRRETTREIFQENNDLITGWEWCAAKSSRTCALCLAMDGKQFPLSEPFPQHVNCRCSMLSVLIGLPSPKRTLGKDWFEAQSDDVKKQILGKEAFEQYQEGNVGLGDFVAFRTDKRFGKSVTRRPLAQILAEKNINVGVPQVLAKSIKYENFEKFKSNALHGRQFNEKVANIIINDPVAQLAYRRIEGSGTKIVFEGTSLDKNTFGLTEKVGPTNLQVRIFLPLSETAESTVSTIVHESRHVKRSLRNKPVATQSEEIMAASIEFVYNFKRRPNMDERKVIRKMVREVYKDLPER